MQKAVAKQVKVFVMAFFRPVVERASVRLAQSAAGVGGETSGSFDTESREAMRLPFERSAGPVQHHGQRSWRSGPMLGGGALFPEAGALWFVRG
jgi:hypothetical protein